jgi:predicted nucleic acid-binding protein
LLHEPLLTAELTAIELFNALLRRERDLPPGDAASSLEGFRVLTRRQAIVAVPWDSRVIRECEQIARQAHAFTPRILVRSLDLIHVASASVAKAEAIVTADGRMRKLAAVLGFNVLPEDL